MAGNVQLAKFLDDAEISTLPDEIKTKLDTYLSTVFKEVDEVKTKHETLRVNSEQQYCEIERQLIDSNKKLEEESTHNAQLKSKVDDLGTKYNEASGKLKTTEESQETNLSTQLRLTKINEQLENEKREFALLIEKRNREIDNLNDELKHLSKKLSEVNTAKCEALVKLDEVSSNEVNKQYQIKRLEQEKDNLQKQVDWLNTDVAKRTQELMEARREKSTCVLELDTQLKEKVEECSQLQATVDSLKSTNTDQVTKIDQLLERIKLLQEGQSRSEEEFTQEIDARKRLAEIYKTAAEDEKAKTTQLTGAVTELQKLLKDASNGYTELENKRDEEVNILNKEIIEKDKKVECLEEELKKANELLGAMKTRGMSDEKLETMFPTAAATSKMLKSGMTLTQIYSEYVKASEDLQLEKEENKRLNTYLDQILQEIEEKAPMLKRQREDYEIALNSIEQMTRQLDAAMVDSQKLQIESDENHRKAAHLTKENHKQNLQIKDLSEQVKFLVKEVEELKAGRVVREEEVSSSDVSNSSQVISNRLLTFRNLDELQAQNQQLLSVVRELSERQEEEENSAIDSRTRELKQQLEQAHEELQNLREAQSRAEDLVASIIQQRDCYKVLLREREERLPQEEKSVFGESSIVRSPNVSTLKSPGTDRMADEMSKALKQVQEEYNTYRKEKLENEKILQEQLDKSRQEGSSLRTNNAKLVLQLDYATERYKVLQGNADGYKKEITLLREKVTRYSASVTKHEQTIKTLRQDMMTVQEKLAVSEARVDNIKAEKDLVKMSEHRLSAELDSLRRERHSQTMLMANLQAIQNNLERNEYETKHRLGKQVETLERDKTYLKKRLTAEEKEHQSAITHWQHQVQENREHVEVELKSHQQTKDLLSNTHKQLQDMKQQLVQVTSKLNSAEARLADKSSDSPGEEGGGVVVRELKAQMEEAQSERDSLQSQLNQAKQHTEQYKTHADTFQQELKELTKVNAESKEELEEKLRESTEACEHLRARQENLETERQELLNENIRITEENHTLSADLRKQLASLQNELQEAVKLRETAIAQETSAKQQCEQQQHVAAESQDKYERELMLHAADVEALTTLKQTMEGHSEKLSGKEEQAKIAELQLVEYKVSSEKKQEQLVKENEKLTARLNDLMNETRALHDQMRKLSNQVISVQEHERAATVTKTSAAGPSEQEASKSAEQLLEVVRYLRKEKEIAEGKLDVAEMECSRLKQRCDAMEKQLELANTQLNEERQQTQAHIQTAAQHAELMLKVESNNLLHDSNKLLREENTQLQSQLAQSEAKLNKLEETIRPLQEEIRTVQAQRESLLVEKKTAITELERWKARTNQLIENAHKTDPEEHKKLVNEKEELRKQLNSFTDDLHKARAEITKTSIEHAKLQRQHVLTKEEVTKLTETNESLTKSKVEFESDAAEKVKTINQLKKIGRKYKEQAESVTKEFEEFKNKQEGDAAQKQTAQQVSTAQIESLEQKLKEVEGKNESLAANVKELESKRDELEKTAAETLASKTHLEHSLKDMVSRRADLEAQVIALRSAKEKKDQSADTETSKLREDFTQLQQELTTLKEENSHVKEEKTELDKKLNRANSILQTAKTKLQSMKEVNEKLSTERQELKKKLETTDNNCTQVEEQVRKLEQDLNTKDTTYQKEVAELQTKVQQLQKQLETSQKLAPPQSQVQVSRSTGSGAQDRASSSPSEPPKTANIRPIASSPAAIKPQTVPVQPQSAASKVTASIRPMAIAPATTTQTTTPTATVMPTTVSQPDQPVEGEVLAPVQQLFSQQMTSGPSRPTQQVQRVIPTQEAASQESTTELPPPAETGVVEPQPSTSRDTPMTSSQSNKRQRDDTESPGEETLTKRSKVAAAAEQESVEIPEITVTDDSQTSGAVEVEGGIELVQDSLDFAAEEEQSQSDEDIFADKEEESQDAEVDQGTSEEEVEEGDVQEEEDDDAVIIVGSDDEEQEGEEDEDDEEDDEDEDELEIGDNVEEFSHEGMEAYPEQEEDIDEELEGEMEEAGYQGDENMQGQDQGNDDVVIIDEEDEESGNIESQEREPQTSQSSSQQLLPPLLPMPPERQLSGGRQSQLTPFMIGGNPGGYEDLDDCTVPSTPTLNIPRRGDGFAEAISSPHVSQSFIFGSGGDQQLGLSGLAQLESQQGLGMGMDETRMDLSHLEEGTGRSVPSTPLHTSAPVTLISDVAERLEGDTAEFGQSDQDQEALGEDRGDATEQGAEGEGEELEEDNVNLEGDQGEEEEEVVETETHSYTAEGNKEGADGSSSQGDDAATSGMDKSQEANKPKIQKIIWTTPPAAPSPSAPAVGQPIQSLLATPTFRPSRPSRGGMPRGPSPQRAGGRGGYQRGQVRRPQRGAVRGNVYRRPPMY